MHMLNPDSTNTKGGELVALGRLLALSDDCSRSCFGFCQGRGRLSASGVFTGRMSDHVITITLTVLLLLLINIVIIDIITIVIIVIFRGPLVSNITGFQQ